MVRLADGKQSRIDHLKPGDVLLTTDGFKTIHTEMMMMLDKDSSMMSMDEHFILNSVSQLFSLAMFYTITTMSGHSISLSGWHLIAIMRNNSDLYYISAKEIQYGDILYILSGRNINSSRVRSIKLELKQGHFAPLTMSGTDKHFFSMKPNRNSRSGNLMVNDILASCYSNVWSHQSAHHSMTPLRVYYQLARSVKIMQPFGKQNYNGIHVVPKWMYKFSLWFYSSAISSK